MTDLGLHGQFQSEFFGACVRFPSTGTFLFLGILRQKSTAFVCLLHTFMS